LPINARYLFNLKKWFRHPQVDLVITIGGADVPL
jgi:hypothetical protein